MLHRRPMSRRRIGHVRQRWPGLQELRHPRCLPAQGVLVASRQQQRQYAGGGFDNVILRLRGLFQHDVRVRPAHAERGHAGSARPTRVGPGRRLGQQFDRARRPVHMGRRRGHVQCLREQTVPHGLDHLDETGETRGRLRVPDVRLHRAQQQRPFAILAVCREQRPGLDRVPQPGTRAVCLHDVHIGGTESRVGQGSTDHPLLSTAARCGHPIGRAVLVGRRAFHHGQDPVTFPAGVRHPFHQHHADALGQAEPVRTRRERLTPAVRREPALPGELHEHARAGHDRDPGHDREAALATAYRLHGQVQCRQ